MSRLPFVAFSTLRNLSGCSLSGPIPQNWEGMQTLQTLLCFWFSDDSDVWWIPHFCLCLPLLWSCYTRSLRSNNLLSPLPQWTLPNLRYLYLSSNKFDEPLLNLQNWPSLFPMLNNLCVVCVCSCSFALCVYRIWLMLLHECYQGTWRNLGWLGSYLPVGTCFHPSLVCCVLSICIVVTKSVFVGFLSDGSHFI